MMFNTIHDLYVSQSFRTLRQVLMGERVGSDGYLRCEHCGEPIVSAYDCIAHHKIEVTTGNLNDINITLNPDNIMLVHHRCHNEIHNRFGRIIRKVYCVYGASRAGKSTYVESVREAGDLLIDLDRIWDCIGGRNSALNSVAFGVRDYLYQCILTRLGKWNNAYIVTTKPDKRVMDKLGAEYILIDTPKDVCLSRATTEEQRQWIEDWFNNPPLVGC